MNRRRFLQGAGLLMASLALPVPVLAKRHRRAFAKHAFSHAFQT